MARARSAFSRPSWLASGPPAPLAQLRDARCRAPLAKVLKALEGEYREEYLFVLGQELARWEATQDTVQGWT